MTAHVEKVWISDYEWWNVTFEDGKPTLVVQSRNMWSAEKDHAASQTMSARTRKIVEIASKQVWGER